MDQEQTCKIALTYIPQLGDILIKNLVSYCGGVEAVFSASKHKLMKIPGIGEKIAQLVIDHRDHARAAAEKENLFLEKHKIKVLFYTDSQYPKRLLHCHDAPVLLYYLGNADLNHPRIVSIVGTRKATAYGKTVCEKIIASLQAHDVMIVSGLAYGIDICAHKKSLELNIPTIGVLGHGLDTLYPAAHKNIAKQMIRCGGLLTDFPSGTRFIPANFPRRNRIIAGLADAIIVIETKVRGGSVITAEIANSYNKDVFAVPGDIERPYSQGCHFLIKTNKAYLLDQPDELPELMGWKKHTTPQRSEKSQQIELPLDLTETEQKLYDLLQQHDMLRIDEIVIKSGVANSEVAAGLLALEFKGVIKSLPGKVYQIIR